MLSRVFSALANGGSTPTVQWLQSAMESGSTVTRVNVFQDYVVLETNKREELAWTNGIIYKKLRESRPARVVPFLVELCRVYDATGIELDRFLTEYLATLTGSRLQLAPFYMLEGKLTTVLSAKDWKKSDVKGCKVIDRSKKNVTVQLNSSKSLRSALLSIVRRKSL